MHITLSGTAERFDREHLSFLHLRLVTTLYDGHTLSAVDNMLANAVSIQVPDTFHRISGAVDFDLVALHRFLDGSADVTHTDVDTGLLCQVSLHPREAIKHH